MRISGDEYVVLLDPSGERILTHDEIRSTLTLGGESPAQGVIRAMHTERASNGSEILREDPAAGWWCDMRSPNGTPVGTSGTGVRALVHALVEWGEIAFEDRRDAIPIGTADGVRDVLVGRAGYAVDLGRWRMTELSPDTFTVQIGRERVTVAVRRGPRGDAGTGLNAGTDLNAGTRLHAVASRDEVRVERGVAHAAVTIADSDCAERQASSLGAAAAAIILRHLGPRDTPHHWAVEMPGGVVGVRLFATEDGEHVSITGAVTSIAHGETSPKREHDGGHVAR